jgi:hypothetical protein
LISWRPPISSRITSCHQAIWANNQSFAPHPNALVEESRISLILDRPEIIILRDADKHPISYEETRETGRMRERLALDNLLARDADMQRRR